MRARAQRRSKPPATVRLGLRLVLFAILIRIGFLASGLLSFQISDDALTGATGILERLGTSSPIHAIPALLTVALIPVALIPVALAARFLARRGSSAAAVVVAGYCLVRIGGMLFWPTTVNTRLPGVVQLLVGALHVGALHVGALYLATLLCLATPSSRESSRAWFTSGAAAH